MILQRVGEYLELQDAEFQSVQDELEGIIYETYQDDEDCTPEEVARTVKSIVDGEYFAWLDDVRLIIEPIHGIGNIEMYIDEVSV